MKRFWVVYVVFVILISGALYVNHSLYKTAVTDSEGKIILPFDNSVLGITGSIYNDYKGKITAFSRKKGFRRCYYDRNGKLLFCGYKDFFLKSGDFYSDGKRIFDIKGKVCAKADIVSLGRDFFVVEYRCKDFYKIENDCVFDPEKINYNLFDTKKGKIVFPGKVPGYAFFLLNGLISFSKSNYYPVEKNGKYGLCDYEGNIIVPIDKSFKIMSVFEDNYICKDESDRYNLCDRNGKNILKESFRQFYILGDKLYLNRNLIDFNKVSNNDGYVYYKGTLTKSDVTIVGLCKSYSIFSDIDYYEVYKDGKYGVWDKKGNEIIKPKYDKIDKYAENVGFIVCKGKFKDEYFSDRNIYGVVNEKGDEIIPFNNIDIKINRNGMIIANKYCGTVLQEYKEYVAVPNQDMPPRMQEGGMAVATEPNYVMKKRNMTIGKRGVFDNKGHNIIPCEYDNIYNIKDYFLLKKGNKSYFCDRNGKVLKEGNMNPSYHNNMIFYENTDFAVVKYYNYKEDRIYNSLEDFIISKNPELKGKNIKVFSNLDHYIIVMGGRK